MKKIAINILNEMSEVLTKEQLLKLQEVVIRNFWEKEKKKNEENVVLLKKFVDSKKVDGCSNKTIKYYSMTLTNYIKKIRKSVLDMNSENIKEYLLEYQENNNCSNVSLDNIRRNISSFYSWLVDYDYLGNNPMSKIGKIKSKKRVKDLITDEDIECLRDAANTRDLAIIDLLYSSGIRVGELVNLNKEDLDLEKRECKVFGKGKKERIVYIDAKTKIHIKSYLNKRNDDNPALFVSLNKPNERLNISGVEILLRKLGNKVLNKRIYPHKFRRSMATRAIGKGMQIEQVQVLLGHSKIETTLCYAQVDQENVSIAHKKYLN